MDTTRATGADGGMAEGAADTGGAPADTASAQDDPGANGRAAAVLGEILIAEDHPVSRLVIEKLVGSLGYRPHVVKDGVAAIEALNRRSFDLLLTDCLMPGMDGYELARRVRASGSTIARMPIVALTASVLSREESVCYQAGIDDVLLKPVDREQLRTAIERWLGKGRQRRERPETNADEAPAPHTERSRVPVLDWDLVASVFGDAQTGARMLGFFLETTQPLVQSLERRDARLGDPAILRETHKLGGAARTAGAWELAVLCESIERACAAADREEVARHLSKLRGTYARLEMAVHDARAGWTGGGASGDGHDFDEIGTIR